MAVETWVLDHPKHGLLEAHVGWPDAIRDVDPHFPENDISKDAVRTLTSRLHFMGEHRRDAVRRRLMRDEQWAKQDLVLTRDGVVFARVRGIRSVKLAFAQSLPDDKLTSNTSVATKPRVDVLADPLGRYVTDIHFKTDDEVVAFTPPEDSPAARRNVAMEESAWKRVAYPLVAGLGKSGFAIAIIVLGPILSRIIRPVLAWIAALIAPLIPDITWPKIPWPDVHLPSIPWPDIDLPSLPSIPWPNWRPPDWVVWLLDHPKVWAPVMLGIFWGINARRNAKRSRAKKDEWARQAEYERLAAAMRDVASRSNDH